MSEPNSTHRTTRQRELSAFLRNRRARIDPATVGIEPGIGSRRVAGLRREELADTANLSIDYYTKLEQGRAGIASASVRSALALALQLDESERRYLDLLLEPNEIPSPSLHPRPQLAELVCNLRPGLAYLLNYRLDIVATNPHADQILLSGAPTGSVPNLARLVFGSAHGRQVYADWRRKAEDVSGILRFALAEYPGDQGLTRLVNDLLTVPAFSHLWRQVLVLDKNHGPRDLVLPDGKKIPTNYETLRAPADPGFSIVIYSPNELDQLTTP
ncbi:helix-turn-helix transcriptional regulator [Mycobacteroides chelonae]|uniref:helix-turn-helix transcriptional regulator n=1 Tax=Mycobacteroides chelonae TaxID=1774 RepID=UPI0018E2AE9F|nr:helix-turn-helix transcriptional regulator [Mycobacteroides chelonae]